MDRFIEELSNIAKVLVKEDPKPDTITVTGRAKEYNGKMYVQIDGSDQLTPIASSTVNIKTDDWVTVQIKNHSATITGNATDPSPGTSYADEINGKVDDVSDQISEFEIVIADKVDTEQLNAVNGRIDNLVSENVTITGKLEAAEGEIDQLQAENVTITGELDAAKADIDHLTSSKADITVLESQYATIEKLEATNADIHNLEADYGSFKQLTTEDLSAINGNIANLETTKLDAESADIRYAQIDFANIGEAAIEKLFSDSGIIGDLVVSEGHITGHLVGVTITGDLIEANTIKADKLVVLGSDGLYYKLNVNAESVAAEQTDYNSINGKIITANTITAEKINVDDLVAFKATVGGFHLSDKAMYSGAKASVDNTTAGTYLGSDGQLNIGDQNQYLKFYKDTNGVWKLEIAASAIKMGTTSIDDYVASKTAITEEVTGNVLTIGENAGKPLRTFEVYGRTRQNLWVNPSGTRNGITVTSNDDGSMSVGGTATANQWVATGANYSLVKGALYTLSIDKPISGLSSGYGFYISSAVGDTISIYYVGHDTHKTFEYAGDYCVFGFNASVGASVSGTYRVMLREATEDEIAAAQMSASTLQEGGTADLPKDHPVTLPTDPSVYAGAEAFEWCPPGINGVEPSAIVTAGKNLVDLSDKTLSSAGYVFNNKQIGYYLHKGKYTFSFTLANAVSNTAQVTLRNSNALSEYITTKVFSCSNGLNVVELDAGEMFDVINLYSNAAGDYSSIQLELGSTATEYEPPAVTSTTIDMQGHALYEIGDARDVLHVDGTGAASIESSCIEVTFPSDENEYGDDITQNNRIAVTLDVSAGFYPDYSRNYMYCDRFSVRYGAFDKSRTEVYISGRYLYFQIPGKTKSEMVSMVAGTKVVYAVSTPQTVELEGTVDLPNLPSSSANVWITSDVQTDLYGEYWTVAGKSVSEAQSSADKAQSSADKAQNDIDNLEIGGRNFVRNRNGAASVTSNGMTVEYLDNEFRIHGTNTKHDAAWGFGDWIYASDIYAPNSVYTISTIPALPEGLYLGNNTYNQSGTMVTANGYLYGPNNSLTFTTPSDTDGRVQGFFGFARTLTEPVDITIKIKLEKGNKATDWTPAPEDVDQKLEDQRVELQEEIDTSIEQVEGQIISTVEATYTTKDEFENEIATIGTQITQNQDSVNFQFSQLNGSLADLNSFKGTAGSQLETITKYIRFLNGDIVLGGSDSKVQLKLENDRISFLDNNNEVMYITDEELSIMRAIIATQLTIGDFSWVPRSNGNVSFRYIG